MAQRVTPEFFWISKNRRIIVAFISIATLQFIAAFLSIQLLSSVRAFVAGESLYSKAQKEAQTFISRYAETHREEDYERFVTALSIPLGDRAARESLQRSDPDIRAAQSGFLAGGNHVDDIEGLITTFRRFHGFPFMARPIATWTEGDAVIEQMQGIARRARINLLAGDPAAPDVVELRDQVPRLNERLSQLTSRFSAELGEASRTTQQILLWLNLAIAAALVLTGCTFIRRSALVQQSTEAKVVERQQSLQRLLDSIVEGLYGIDLAGRCTFINRAALRMLGYEHEADLLGRDMREAIGPSATSLHAAGPVSPAADQRFRRRDGSSFPVESWSHPVLDEGAARGAVVTFFDVTQRLEMQGALRRGEANLQRLIDSVTDGVVTIDNAGRILLFNAAAEAMFNSSAAEAMGLAIGVFIVGGEAAIEFGSTGIDLPLPENPAESVRELLGRRTDGSQFPVEASVSRLETEGGLLTTFVLRDVSTMHAVLAERRARQALEAANQAKVDFLSRMSHELRTPLNAVIGFSQLLRADQEQLLSDAQQARVRHIEVAGEHLLALVNDVLDLARIEAGKIGLLEDEIRLCEIIDEAATMVSPLVTKAGIQVFLPSETVLRTGLGFDPARGPHETVCDFWVRADRVRLRQILVNLLSNAIKYNRPGGHVELNVRAVDAGRCEISVVDTGQGIAADRMDSLFQPFNRLGAEETKVQGTGIGLVLSRQLAEMMGGSLEIESAFGLGTAARLCLLLVSEPPKNADPAKPSTNHQVPSRLLSVIYAEDNEVNAELMRHIVAMRPNVTLRIAENGQAALDMASEDPPDLMLVDMNLGDMTGIELSRHLQADRATRSIRLVALSADVLPEQIDLALRSGFEAYMTKPFDYQALLRFLDEW